MSCLMLTTTFEVRPLMDAPKPFPLVMLAVDLCFPATREDAQALERSLLGEIVSGIRLTTCHATGVPPLHDLEWMRAGWEIVPESYQTR